MGQTSYKNRLLDVRKDRLDLRDRLYRPLLNSLPPSYPQVEHLDEVIRIYRTEKMILDQGSSGACTGYALASVINYLLWSRALKQSRGAIKGVKVSPKMLFNLARIYDEWEGEDYTGSSCRGAMKGWHKHGVCPESYWYFDDPEPSKGWERASVEHPLGAYYRVEKDSIADMQSALCEVGALYASASIHDGWWSVKSCLGVDAPLHLDRDLPKIVYDTFPRGNHAFMIVGYTRYGFILQNSWGEGWGNCGFALLSYEDWLANGLDVWVAVMGVPVEVERSPWTVSTKALTTLSADTPSTLAGMNAKRREERAYEHTLVLNANGGAKHTIVSASTLDRSLEIICYENLKRWVDASPKHRKVMVYALGGLVDEKVVLTKIERLIPAFLDQGIYPFFLTWREGYLQAIEHSFGGDFALEGREDVNQEALDRAIENRAKEIGTRGIWMAFKAKAKEASHERIQGYPPKKSGVLYTLTMALKRVHQLYDGGIELHAMAHSAGAELVGSTWLRLLEKHKIHLHSLHLIAPTLSLEDANRFLIRADRVGVLCREDLHLYLLDQALERSDQVGPYRRSILYLISRALEGVHKAPLLGLADTWDLNEHPKDDGPFYVQQWRALKRWHRFALPKEEIKRCSLTILDKRDAPLLCSHEQEYVKLSHANLDRSVVILEEILTEVLGQESSAPRVTPLC